jgi:hypothetical protein
MIKEPSDILELKIQCLIQLSTPPPHPHNPPVYLANFPPLILPTPL